MKHHDIPSHVESISQVHYSQQALYEFDEQRGGYSLTPAGYQLQRLRKNAVANPHSREFPHPGANPAPIELRDWTVALGCATPEERRQMLAALGQGRLVVQNRSKR